MTRGTKSHIIHKTLKNDKLDTCSGVTFDAHQKMQSYRNTSTQTSRACYTQKPSLSESHIRLSHSEN